VCHWVGDDYKAPEYFNPMDGDEVRPAPPQGDLNPPPYPPHPASALLGPASHSEIAHNRKYFNPMDGDEVQFSI